MDLDLATDTASLTKWQTLQESIIHILHQQQYDWFQSHGLTMDDIRGRFQPFLQGTVLSIYLSTLLRSGKPIYI